VWDEYDFSDLKFEPLSSFITNKFQQSITLFMEILKKLLEEYKLEGWTIPGIEEFKQKNNISFQSEHVITGASGSI